MSLKRKIAAAMALLVVVMLGLNWFALHGVLMPSFEKLERRELKTHALRVEKAVEAEARALGPTVVDWAVWGQADDFMGGAAPTFPDKELRDEALHNVDIDYWCYYTKDARVFWSRGVDSGGNAFRLAELDPQRNPVLLAQLAKLDGGATVSGLLWTTRGPMIVSLHHVQTSSSSTTWSGSMLMGRLLNPERIERLRHQLELDFDITALRPGSETRDPEVAGLLKTPHYADESGALSRSSLVSSLAGEPILLIDVRIPRDVTRIGDRSVHLGLLSIAVIGLASMVLTGVMLQHIVLRPLGRIERHMAQQGQASRFEEPLPEGRRDELGVLAHEYNRMMARLAELQAHEEERSFHDGQVEAAAGTLHNVRNALTPLVNRLDALALRAGELPGQHLSKALAELGGEATDPERAQRLLGYARSAAAALDSERTGLTDELRAAAAAALTLDEILDRRQDTADGRIGRAPVVLEDIARQAAGMIRTQFPELAVDIGPLASGRSLALSHRVLLGQILHNLMLNAAEAVAVTGRADGSIRLGLEAVTLEGVVPAWRLTVTDNGMGIAADRLEGLFQRRASSKDASRGIGLHWCANTVLALGGRLSVASRGPGLGASFQLVLPAAVQDAPAPQPVPA